MHILLDSYPFTACRQASPIERNPVCALTFGVCADLCRELGGLQFDIHKSIVTADSLLTFLAQNAWSPPDAEQCHRWLAKHITNSAPTFMCACAIVAVSIASMSDAPTQLKSLGRNLRCLIYGAGNCMYDHLCSAVEKENIDLSLSAYISTPILPTPQIPTHPTRMQATQNNQYNAPVINGPVINGTVYMAPVTQYFNPSTSVSSVSDSDPSSSSFPDRSQDKDSRTKQLFADPQRTTEERNRFLNYLTDHKISSRLLDSSQDNPVLKAAVCFCIKWKKLHYISSKYSPSAVVRFLTENCGLRRDEVSDKAISNSLGAMLKRDYDKELYYDVCNYF